MSCTKLGIGSIIKLSCKALQCKKREKKSKE
nr:MAG TPA: hypothetical protein [Caudoviricetes sp.]